MKEGYKQTVLGLIPNDWVIKNIGDELEIVGGGTPDTSRSDFWNGEILWFTPTEIKSKLVSRSIRTITEKGCKNSSAKILPVGTLLFTSRATIGDVAFCTKECTTNQGFQSILPNCKYNMDFLYYWFANNKDKFLRKSSGSTFLEISKNEMSKIKFSVPPIQEQTAIADCLNIWDNAIELQSFLIEAKDIRHKNLLQQLLSGKKRLPGFIENWKEVRLGDLFAERNETKIDHLPLLSIGQDGVYPQTDSNKRDISNADKSKYKRILPGDIGYNTMRMWQGRSALSRFEGIVSPAYTILVPKEKVNCYYFSLLFRTSKLTNLFWRNSQGLVDDTLNCKYKDFSIIKYSVPSFEEQNAIASIFAISEKEISIEKLKLEKLKLQRKALMQQLLTGRKRLRIAG
jgi:type I restriction enzyme S subunit